MAPFRLVVDPSVRSANQDGWNRTEIEITGVSEALWTCTIVSEQSIRPESSFVKVIVTVPWGGGTGFGAPLETVDDALAAAATVVGADAVIVVVAVTVVVALAVTVSLTSVTRVVHAASSNVTAAAVKAPHRVDQGSVTNRVAACPIILSAAA